MLKYEDIKIVELELSSHCNAQCPLCPRNLFGYQFNAGYPVRHLLLEDVKTIIDAEFLKQIDRFVFEGNFGDPLMNQDLIDIVEYLNKPVTIMTNGSLQTVNFWTKLAGLPVTVVFGIDGLQGVHEVYRRGTDYDRVIKNATTFINAGGKAVWKMIEFDHNKHQITECEQLSKQLGFFSFDLVNHGRNNGPVFNKDGKLETVIGNFTGSVKLSHYKDIIDHGDMLIEDIEDKPKNSVKCKSIEASSIYISSDGEVYPCCFMGFSPRTYGKGRWHQPVNKQITAILSENNALKKPLKQCIDWFENIPGCWKKTSYEDGRLIVCDSACGK
jgi:MoaA/NifB/PqqE/SkfB family radical SAM enzyme